MEKFEYISQIHTVKNNKHKVNVLNTINVKEKWINKRFDVNIGDSKNYKDFVYCDTMTMNLHIAKNHYKICYISSHFKIFIMCVKGNRNPSLALPLQDYANAMSQANIEVRTPVEKQLVKIVFATVAPDTQLDIKYTTEPLSKENTIYCFLVDLDDPILSYIRKQETMLLSYDMNLDKSRYFVPFHESTLVDIASIYDIKSIDGNRIKCMSFTYCLWSPLDVEFNDATKISNIDKIGFLSRFFKVSGVLLNKSVIQNSNSKPKKYMAETTPFTSRILKKENGYFLIKAKPPLPPGHNWVIVNEKENIFENAKPLKFSSIDQLNIVTRTSDHVIVHLNTFDSKYSNAYFTDIKKMANVSKIDINKYQVYISITDLDKVKYYSKYSCVTNAELEFDFQCKEENGDVWDRPCITDIECPFYQINTGRGGCLPDGRCEMPIGVDIIGYRKYDMKTKPFCENCYDRLSNPYCCEDERFPNFAFPLAEFSQYQYPEPSS